jgi:hypothetical protein
VLDERQVVAENPAKYATDSMQIEEALWTLAWRHRSKTTSSDAHKNECAVHTCTITTRCMPRDKTLFPRHRCQCVNDGVSGSTALGKVQKHESGFRWLAVPVRQRAAPHSLSAKGKLMINIETTVKTETHNTPWPTPLSPLA